MKFKLLNVLSVVSVVLLGIPNESRAGARWHTFAPAGEGFSLDVPGEPQPNAKPGYYVYSVGTWSLFVQVQPATPRIGESVESGDRKAIARQLERMRDSMIDVVKGTRRSSSSADFDGYPSIRFSFTGEVENISIEAIDRIVLTNEHTYILATVGPKGQSNADAQRFLDSFRVVKTGATPTRSESRRLESSKNTLVTKLAGPVLAAARLLSEEKLNPQIDQILQAAPAARRLGTRWNSSNAAWQNARGAFTRRIAQVAALYKESGELDRQLALGLAGFPSGADALAALNGPAGAAILREGASLEFVVAIMASDPNGPKAGERAWSEKMQALRRAFDARIGPEMPENDGTHAAAVEQYMSSEAGRAFVNVCGSVIGKAEVQIEGALNLLFFDDREAILREIDAAIAQAK